MTTSTWLQAQGIFCWRSGLMRQKCSICHQSKQSILSWSYSCREWSVGAVTLSVSRVESGHLATLTNFAHPTDTLLLSSNLLIVQLANCSEPEVKVKKKGMRSRKPWLWRSCEIVYKQQRVELIMKRNQLNDRLNELSFFWICYLTILKELQVSLKDNDCGTSVFNP